MSDAEVFATFGRKAVGRSVSALTISLGLIAAAIYGQIGPGVHANVGSAIGLSMVALAGGFGKWLLSSFQIGYNILFKGSRALYSSDEHLIFISPIWIDFDRSRIDKVDIIHLKYKNKPYLRETVRVTPREGEPKYLPPGLTRESPAEILTRVSEWVR